MFVLVVDYQDQVIGGMTFTQPGTDILQRGFRFLEF